MKRTWYKIIFGLIKKMFIVLLTSMCVLLSNWKWEIQPTPISLHPNEYSQEFHYYPFVVRLNSCTRNCNTFNDLSNKVCAPNKTENLDLSIFNMITGINK